MEDRLQEANRIVQNRIWWSVAGGLVPIPWVDIVAVTSVQLSMIASLSKLYNVPFMDNKAKNIIAVLMGSIIPSSLARGTVGSALKAVPVFGQTIGSISMSAFSGAATYAIGKVFIQHFETGGTLLDFDIDKMRGHFEQEFEAGKTKAQQIAAEKNSGTKPAGK